MIAIELSNQEALDADPTAIQQINFTGNFYQAGNTSMLLILEKVKETILDFSQRNVRML